MSLGLARKRLTQTPVKAEEEDPSQCQATGCPLRATVSIGSTGRYTCTAHAFCEAKQWPSITQRARELKWFAEFIAEVQSLPGKEWVTLAEEFWKGQDERMLPSDFERKSQEAYLYRCLGELQHRLGARKNAPDAWQTPNYVKGGSRFAQLVGSAE